MVCVQTEMWTEDMHDMPVALTELASKGVTENINCCLKGKADFKLDVFIVW
jgi:hypothetical protein